MTDGRQLAVYVGCRDRLTVGRHPIHLAWTEEDASGSERIEAITSHVVRVLPRRPVGTWSDDAVPTTLLDQVLARIGNAAPADAASAFQAIADSLTREPGQLAYDENGDALAAPDLLEFDAYLNATGDSPARGNDRGGLIVDFASMAIAGAIYNNRHRRPKVWIDCHGLAQLMALIGQLLGLPVERWTLTSPRLGKKLTRLGGGTYEEGKGLSSHSVVAWHDHPGGARVFDIALTEDGRPRWDTLTDYATRMDSGGSVWRRRSTVAAKPLFFFSTSQLRGRGLDTLADAVEKQKPTGSDLWGIYVGRGQPGWARAIWIGAEGMKNAGFLNLPRDSANLRLDWRTAGVQPLLRKVDGP